jgi:hypothetical protein
MKIAHMIHNIYGAGVIAALGDASLPIPRQEAPVESWMEWPGVGWDFLGKDVTEGMKLQWHLITKHLQQAKFCYDWVYENRPDAILLWNDEYPHYRGALTAAKELGIPTAELVHGNIQTKKLGHWSSIKHCDWVLGATWEFRDWYEFYNPEHVGRVVVSGSVAQDPFAGMDQQPEVRQTARDELRLGLDVPVITFLTDAVFKRGAWQDPALRYQSALDFFHAFKLLRLVRPDAHLIVKVHPYEGVDLAGHHRDVTPTDYQKVLEASGITQDFTVLDDPLVLAVAASDLLVGNASSAMATGYHFGVPSLVLGYEPFYDVKKHDGRGAIVARDGCDTLEMLCKIIMEKDLMDNLILETTRGVDYFSGTQDGRAAQRVAEALKAIAQGETPGEGCWTRPEQTEPVQRIQPEGRIHQRGLSTPSAGGPSGGFEHDPLAMGDLGDPRDLG